MAIVLRMPYLVMFGLQFGCYVICRTPTSGKCCRFSVRNMVFVCGYRLTQLVETKKWLPIRWKGHRKDRTCNHTSSTIQLTDHCTAPDPTRNRIVHQIHTSGNSETTAINCLFMAHDCQVILKLQMRHKPVQVQVCGEQSSFNKH